MNIHDLKIWPEYFKAVKSGDKTFEVSEVRDRHFEVGDILKLREWDPAKEAASMGSGYSGDQVNRRVTYIMQGGQFGLAPGFVVMGIRPVIEV